MIGSIVERKPSASPKPPGSFSTPDPATGFPTISHRSRSSAFGRARRATSDRFDGVPAVASSIDSAGLLAPAATRPDSSQSPAFACNEHSRLQQLMQEVGTENDRKLEAMSEEDKRMERDELMTRFGGGVGEMLKKRRLRREGPVADELVGVIAKPTSENGGSAAFPDDISVAKAKEMIDDPKTILRDALKSALQGESSTKASQDEGHLAPPDQHRAFGETASAKAAVLEVPTRSTTPGTPSRRLRFADVTPSDIHVYPSQPPSPKPVRLLMARPPSHEPDDGEDPIPSYPLRFRALPPGNSAQDDSSPGSHTAPALTGSRSEAHPTRSPLDEQGNQGEPEEGTPEDIRRRFFPSESASLPSLEWMSSPSSNPSEASALRFDLQGAVIPSAMQESLPTHLGLHHTASTLAGYTLDDLLHLSRSTVSAQRTTVLTVLTKVVRRLGNGELDADKLGPNARERILESGLAALGERGSLGARAVDVIWESLVGWDESYVSQEGAELRYDIPTGKGSTTTNEDTSLRPSSSLDLISRIEVDEVLPLFQSYFTSPPSFPPATLSRLLGILHRLASHSITIATTMVKDPAVISTLLSICLAGGGSADAGNPCDPSLIALLRVLAASSRANARALTPDVPDALLRFLTLVPTSTSSGEERDRLQALLAETLEFYGVLARYGLYSGTAITVQELASPLIAYISSNITAAETSLIFLRMVEAWVRLREAWMICAIDPHNTTPPHDILWSQVNAWSWSDELLDLANKFTQDQESCWTSLWSAVAGYAEGTAVNSVRGGEKEKALLLDGLMGTIDSGNGRTAIDAAVEGLSLQLDTYESLGASKTRYMESLQAISKYCSLLTAVTRLSLSLMTPTASTSDPLGLPAASISRLTDAILDSTLWDDTMSIEAPPGAHVHLRALTTLLVHELKLSIRLGTASTESWSVKALRTLRRLLPGDESLAEWILSEFSQRLEPIANNLSLTVDSAILANGGFEDLKPFYAHALRPDPTVQIAPYIATPDSLSASTTLTLPSLSSLVKATPRPANETAGLPLQKDWLLRPLDDLLRSGSSSAFDSFPVSWSASETEIVRSTLLAVEIYQQLLMDGYRSDAFSREEIIFTCMKIFMLEHGQPQEDSSEDVFRDELVSRKMRDLLEPFTISSSSSSPIPLSSLASGTAALPPMEKVSERYLGKSTPFYQFYADFLALYEAISFSDATFARLLLPPLSQQYALDYRQLFWGDHSVAIRTVRTPLEDVLADSAEEYLWPLETDTEMLSRYMRALIGQLAHGFLRMLALHHVSCTIWSAEGGDDAQETRRRHMIMALLKQNRREVVHDVLAYVPFIASSEHKLLDREERIEWVRSWTGEDVAARLSAA